MDQSFKIAGIDIQLCGSDLLSIMSGYEKQVLKPFSVRAPSKKIYFRVNARFAAARTNKKNSKTLLEKIRSDFSDRIFAGVKKSALGFFKEQWLRSLDARVNKNCEVIMTPYSFFIFDKKLWRCDIFLKKDKILSQKRVNPAYMPGLIILKLLFRLILNSENNGILLHASSAENNGYGYVFIGPSGYGKSTVVKMLGPGRGLSDETSIIKNIGKRYVVFTSPWWNKDSRPSIRNPQKGLPLKAIFFIERADKTGIKKMGYKETLAELIYRDNPFQQLRFFDNKSGIRNFYLFAQNIIRDIPVFKLSIKKHKEFKKEFKGLLREFNLE